MISLSGIPSGKFRFTQSDSARTFHSLRSRSWVVNCSTFWITTSSMTSMRRSRTSAQLAVNAARFMAFGADDVQAARISDAGREFDVRAAAGHVRCDGHSSPVPGASDDFGLLLMILGVQHGMNDARSLEHA